MGFTMITSIKKEKKRAPSLKCVLNFTKIIYFNI